MAMPYIDRSAGRAYSYTREQMTDFRRRCLCECHHETHISERPYSVQHYLCEPCLDGAYQPWTSVLESLV